jgi:hypothetical protein
MVKEDYEKMEYIEKEQGAPSLKVEEKLLIYI